MMLQWNVRAVNKRRLTPTSPRMLDSTALALLNFNVIVVSDAILEGSHLHNDKMIKINSQFSEMSLQIHELEKFVTPQQRLLGSGV